VGVSVRNACEGLRLWGMRDRVCLWGMSVGHVCGVCLWGTKSLSVVSLKVVFRV
jgi:hypothetical protein